jgi:hypothetical protein
MHYIDPKTRWLLGCGLLCCLAASVEAGPYNEDDDRAWRLSQPQKAVDEDDPDTFVFARLEFVTLHSVLDKWDVHLYADDNLMAFLRNNTQVQVSNKPARERCVSIDDAEKIYKTPFLFMTGDGGFKLSIKHAEVLREFFNRGGFLYGDDCVTDRRTDYFFKAFIREIGNLFPGNPMRPVPKDHEIYHCYYDFPKGNAPHGVGTPHKDMGLFIDDRLVAFVTSGDIHCAWNGNRDPALQRIKTPSRKMGVNIIIYSLTH